MALANNENPGAISAKPRAGKPRSLALEPLRGRGGFTLIELVSTLLILMLLGAFIATRLTGVDVVTISSGTGKIKAHLRYAQMRAMSSSSIWGINSTGGTYWLFKDGDPTKRELLPAESVEDDGDGDPYLVTLPANMTLTAGVVSFDSWGTPYTDAAGATVAVADLVATVAYGSVTRTITVTAETGFIP